MILRSRLNQIEENIKERMEIHRTDGADRASQSLKNWLGGYCDGLLIQYTFTDKNAFKSTIAKTFQDCEVPAACNPFAEWLGSDLAAHIEEDL